MKKDVSGSRLQAQGGTVVHWTHLSIKPILSDNKLESGLCAHL